MDVPPSIESDLQPFAPGMLESRFPVVTGSTCGLGVAQVLTAQGVHGVLNGSGKAEEFRRSPAGTQGVAVPSMGETV